jgi:hypothetical protein
MPKGHLATALSLKHFPFQFDTYTEDAKPSFLMKQFGNVRRMRCALGKAEVEE